MKQVSTLFILLFFASFAFAQAPSIPIDFESDMLTYTWSDFGGGVGSVIDNPDASGINTSSKVAQVVKFEGEVFGGTTLGLAGPVDFGDNNAIKMKVWANRVDAPVLFKFEGPTPQEVSMNTTVANQWEELTFSFAGLTGFEFTAITIIYDLGVVGDGGADFTVYLDDIEFTTVTGGVELPVDFESTELTYTFSDFGGGVASVIDNPDASGINTSGKVGQMVKFEGEVFGGSTLALGGALDFGDNNAIKMKVWANRVGAPITFKLEGPAPTEVAVSTTVANQWEELTFSFAGLTGGTYSGITIIYDLGVVGDGGPDFTMYFDDIDYTTVSTTGGVQLPIDFESTELMYTWSDFGGGVGSVIDNPDASGINTSGKVAQMVKFEGEVFGGSTLALGGPIDFGSNNAIKMKVWANRVDAPVTFKLEGPVPVEVAVSTTVASQWEELVFNFAGLTGGTYTGITIIYDLGVVGDGSPDFTMYFDDIDLTTDMTPGVQLPVDFESTEFTYNWSDFAGGVATVIANPQQDDGNISNTVTQMVKFEGEVFGGSTLALSGAIDFGGNTEIEMKVFANRVGAPVLLKLEGPAPVERSLSTSVADQWENLVYDFSGDTGGTYTGITIIYDLGVVGDGGPDFTMLFDDIRFPGSVNVVDVRELNVTYFPNPARDFVVISAEEQVEAVSIFDLNGQRVYSERMSDNQRRIDVSTLPAGTYFIKVKIGEREGVAKLIKG